jgi:hypothetical protein
VNVAQYRIQCVHCRYCCNCEITASTLEYSADQANGEPSQQMLFVACWEHIRVWHWAAPVLDNCLMSKVVSVYTVTTYSYFLTWHACNVPQLTQHLQWRPVLLVLNAQLSQAATVVLTDRASALSWLKCCIAVTSVRENKE